MKALTMTKKIIRNTAVALCVLLLTSCWDNFSNELMDYNDSTPPEVILINSTATTNSVTLNWTEPLPATYSAVRITSSSGADITVYKGTTSQSVSLTTGVENTVILTAIYSTGPRSKPSVFRVTPGVSNIHFIYTPAQLNTVPDGSTDYWIVMADLDLAGYSSGTGWSPIGTSGSAFAGTFDGNGYTISNLYINNPTTDYQGLFGQVNNATIKNTNITGCNITGKNYVGGLAGFINCTSGNSYTIDNCFVDGTVASTGIATGGFAGGIRDSGNICSVSNCKTAVNVKLIMSQSINYDAGGFAGYYESNDVNSKIEDCTANGNITITSNNTLDWVIRAGGFIGHTADASFVYATITECIATGVVTFNGDKNCNIGGFVGLNQQSANISNCSSSGDVTGNGGTTNTSTGGFVGYATGSSSVLNNCKASGNVKGITYTGGFSGVLINGTIEGCTATGNVSGVKYTGGFSGCIGNYPDHSSGISTVTDCYATGTITVASNAGGFSGCIEGLLNSEPNIVKINKCYATGNVSGTNYAGGFSGTIRGFTINLSNGYSIGNASGSGTNYGFGYKKNTDGTQSITSCFYNSQTAGNVTAGVGTAKSTSEMHTQSTYTGWDFVGETVNGTDDYWTIGSLNSGYP